MFALTTRENEIMTLICQGLTNNEIAKLLFISKHTVKAHICAIMEKFHTKSRAGAVYIYCKNILFKITV